MSDRTRPWSKLFWSDWESDVALRQCSLAAQGLWMRILCICARAEPRGYLTINGVTLDVAAVATAVSRPETEVAPLMHELEHWGVFSRDRKRRIYSRRMVRDERRSNDGRRAKKDALSRSSQATEKGGENCRPSRVPKRGASTHIPEARNQDKRINPQTPLGRGVFDDEGASLPPGEQTSVDGSGSVAGRGEKPVHPPNSARPPSVEPDPFDEFWAAYPLKKDKKDARKAYRAALKREKPEAILEGAKRYATLCRQNGTEPQFIRHAPRWLRGDCWADETLKNVVALPGQRTAKAHEAWKAALDLYFAGKWDGWREPVPSDFNDEGERCDLFVQRQAEGAGK